MLALSSPLSLSFAGPASGVSMKSAPQMVAANNKFAYGLPGGNNILGEFDPLNLLEGKSKLEVYKYREAELTHGRVAMLASLGFLVQEKFHPLFGGAIDEPSLVAFQATPLQTFWPVTVLIVGTVEIFSVLTYQSPFDGKWWTLKSEHTPGDYSFDPAGLKPTGAIELKDMQTMEMNNGRLAMSAIAGMVGQELATGAKLFFAGLSPALGGPARTRQLKGEPRSGRPSTRTCKKQ